MILFIAACFGLVAVAGFLCGYFTADVRARRQGFASGYRAGVDWASRLARHFYDQADPTEVNVARKGA